jgi:hypothetical protein
MRARDFIVEAADPLGDLINQKGWTGPSEIDQAKFDQIMQRLTAASKAEETMRLSDLLDSYQKWETDHIGKEPAPGEKASEWDLYEALCLLVGAGFGYWDYDAGT